MCLRAGKAGPRGTLERPAPRAATPPAGTPHRGRPPKRPLHPPVPQPMTDGRSSCAPAAARAPQPHVMSQSRNRSLAGPRRIRDFRGPAGTPRRSRTVDQRSVLADGQLPLAVLLLLTRRPTAPPAPAPPTAGSRRGTSTRRGSSNRTSTKVVRPAVHRHLTGGEPSRRRKTRVSAFRLLAGLRTPPRPPRRAGRRRRRAPPPPRPPDPPPRGSSTGGPRRTPADRGSR